MMPVFDKKLENTINFYESIACVFLRFLIKFDCFSNFFSFIYQVDALYLIVFLTFIYLFIKLMLYIC